MPNFPPKAHRPYRIPHRLQLEVDRQTEEMLKDGKIARSTSAFAHPVVCVTKADSSVRICGDLRYINTGIIPDSYLMPRPDSLLLDISAEN